MTAPHAVTAYPLCWPESWPRSRSREAGDQFVTRSQEPGQTWMSSRPVTYHRARRLLLEELGRLKATAIILSSNIELRLDGEPRAGEGDRRLSDPGIAVYFTYKGKPMVMATDRYATIAANVRSLGLAIEAMRQPERHGGGQMMERAFAGFTALPPPEGSKPKRPWWEIMRYPADPAERELLSVGEIEARYRTLAKKYHPDSGTEPSGDLMTELNQAKEDAVAELTPASQEKTDA